MSTSHTHVTVRDCPPPQREAEVVATLFAIIPEAEPETQFSRVNIEPEDIEDEAETKVVKPRRGRRPAAATEVAETK